MLIAQHAYPFNSDDVSWQTTLLTWKPFGGQKAYVGAKDNFIVNVPFILIFDHFIKAGRTQLIVEAVFFAVLNFILFYFAALYFLKKAKIRLNYRSLLPFIWLASFGFGFSSLFLNTNWRDYEVGVSFIFYAIASKYYFNEINPTRSKTSKLATIILIGLAGLFTYSDPYFYYFTVLPIAMFYVLLYIFKSVTRHKLLVIVASSLLILIISRGLTSVFARVGIIAPHGYMTYTSLKHLPRTLYLTWKGVENIFGISFSGVHSIISLGNFLLVGLVMLFLISLLNRNKSTRSHNLASFLNWEWFFYALSAFVTLAYIASDNGTPGNDRYLILIPYIFALILALNITRLKKVPLFIISCIIILTVLSNVSVLYNRQKTQVAANSLNSRNYALISAIEKVGLTKGYAEYWDSDINTYLSGGNVNFLPITCRQGTTHVLPLLVNGGLYSQPAARTFVVIDPDYNSPPMCKESRIIAQFGQPQQTIQVLTMSVLVYNYDIVTKMPGKP